MEPIHEAQRHLHELRVDCEGVTVSVRRDLEAKKVIPMWPAEGKVGILRQEEVLTGELRDLILVPHHCLLPSAAWPPEQRELEGLCYRGGVVRHRQGRFGKGHFLDRAPGQDLQKRIGEPAMVGAMGVDKWKAEAVQRNHYLRFISILTPVSDCMRRLGRATDS